MNKKTVKALHALLKELYQSRAVKQFVDEYEREEHDRRHRQQDRKPKAGEVYRDIFGNKYTVLIVVENFHDEMGINRPFVSLLDISKSRIHTPTLKDFMNPTLKKE